MRISRMRPVAAALALGPALPRFVASQEHRPSYSDPKLPIEARVSDLLACITGEETFWQLFMGPGNRADTTHDWSHCVFGLPNRSAADARRDAMAYDAP